MKKHRRLRLFFLLPLVEFTHTAPKRDQTNHEAKQNERKRERYLQYIRSRLIKFQFTVMSVNPVSGAVRLVLIRIVNKTHTQKNRERERLNFKGGRLTNQLKIIIFLLYCNSLFLINNKRSFFFLKKQRTHPILQSSHVS